MSKPRIAEWTELRGLAYLAVVLQHCIGEYIYRSDIQQPDSVMLAMLYHLTRFGTPTFVFLSAALLFIMVTNRLATLAILAGGFEIFMFLSSAGRLFIGYVLKTGQRRSGEIFIFTKVCSRK